MLRKTPLRRTTPLRPKAPKRPWRRAEADKVTPAEGNYVAARDRVCVLSFLEPGHTCYDRFGNEIAPDGIYELDHIDNGGTGSRGPSTRWNLVRLCPYAHMRKTYMARLYRPILRAYIERVERVAA